MKKFFLIILFSFFSFIAFNFKTYANKCSTSFCYEGDDNGWRYDITNLVIEEIDGRSKMTVEGWAVIEGINIGKNYVDANGVTRSEYSPAYIMQIVDEDGNVYTTNSYYSAEPSDFSVTCPLYFSENGISCFNEMDNGGYNARNQIPNLKFYDNTDFSIPFDITDLKSNKKYYLQLQIKVGDWYSDWKRLTVLSDSIHNHSAPDSGANTVFEVRDDVNTVQVVARCALVQQGGITSRKSNSIRSGFWFNYNETYTVNGYENDKEIRGHSNYRYYELVLNKNECNRKNEEYGWAYSAWIEPNSSLYFTIERKDPCDDYKYAKENADECCNPETNEEIKWPEACCGVENYVNSDKFNITQNWQNQYCCSNEEQFQLEYNGEIVSYNTFKYYLNNPPSPSFFITQSFINQKCSKVTTTEPKSCSKNTSKIDDSTLYSMSYLKVNIDNNGNFTNFIETENNYETVIKLDKKPNKILTKDDIAYDYFSQSDYSEYIKQNNNPKVSMDNLFVKSSYKAYALDKNNFTFEIKKLEKLSDTQYKIYIKAKVNDEFNSTKKPINNAILGKDVLPSNTGVYYLPLKLWLCDSEGNNDDDDNTNTGGNRCEDPSFFNKYEAYCCELDPYKNTDRCTIKIDGEPPEYNWDKDVSCNKETSQFSGEEKVMYSDSNCTITCQDSIELLNYPTLSSMMQNPFKIGTGFEYGFKVKDKVTCDVTYRSKMYSSYDAIETAINKCNNKLAELNYDNNKYNETLKKQDIKMDNEKESYIYSNLNKESSITNRDSKNFYYQYLTTCHSPDGPYLCSDETKVNLNYDKSLTYTYTYDAELPLKEIKKDDATKIETVFSQSNKPDYVFGGNKHYLTNITTSGIYTFNIGLKNMGITGNSNSNFSCQFQAIDSKNGVTVCDPETDPNCPEECEEGPCIDPNETKGYYFRPISLNNPFPNNRTLGTNWQGNAINESKTKTRKYITERADDVYGDTPMYEIVLDSSLISAIREYNDYQEKESRGGYLDWSSMNQGTYNEFNQTSKFIDYLSSNSDASHSIFSGQKGKIKVRNNLDREDKIGEFSEVGES